MKAQMHIYATKISQKNPKTASSTLTQANQKGHGSLFWRFSANFLIYFLHLVQYQKAQAALIFYYAFSSLSRPPVCPLEFAAFSAPKKDFGDDCQAWGDTETAASRAGHTTTAAYRGRGMSRTPLTTAQVLNS